MNYVFQNADVFCENQLKKMDVLVSDGRVADISPTVGCAGAVVFDFKNCVIFPGFADVHVHLREPGFSYKETIASGSAAAARGGFTAVCPMPNLSPPPDCPENLAVQLEIAKKTAVVNVIPYGTITRGEGGEELSDMEGLAPFVAGFSDDGRGVQSGGTMRRAMEKAAGLHKIIAAHCEDESLLNGGYIHDGAYARLHGHRGISSESEWRQIERDLRLSLETGCAYHVCHVSAKESVALIRAAKARGADVTCETAPHYLALCDMDIREDGRFKMNPPIRGTEDRDALIEGIADGTIDMIATDHAPHSAEEKSRGLAGSLNGVVGLETAFPVLYTRLVKTGIIPLGRLLWLISGAPRERFGLGPGIRIGGAADLTVFNLNSRYIIDPDAFLSKGRSSPFAGDEVFGQCMLTMVGGKIAWRQK